MLQGKHLFLKAATPEDLPIFAEWWSDPKYMGNSYNVWPMTPEVIPQIMHEQNKDGGYYLVIHREENKPIGTSGYFNPFSFTMQHQGFEIWYQVHPDFRQKGVATQTACLLINHLFNATPTERLQGTAVTENEASCRVLEKAGMQREGILRSVFFLNGRYVDMALYSIVRGDWTNEPAYRGRCPEF